MSTLQVTDQFDRRSSRSRGRSSPRSSQGEWAEWPVGSVAYTPYLESGADISLALQQFEAQELSRDAVVRHINTTSISGLPQDNLLDLTALARSLQTTEVFLHRFYFINRFLQKSNVKQLPRDARKLQISAPAFRLLFTEIGIPPAFIGAISRVYQPCGRGSRWYKAPDASQISDFWYVLPVRVQVACTDTKKAHAMSTAGSNQMDPFNYLHLPDEKLDIRGSHIGIYSQHDLTSNRQTFVVVSLQDGRWSRVVEEPQNRILEVLEGDARSNTNTNPFSMHLIYLTYALRLWTNVLASFNNQLISHETSLQTQIDDIKRYGDDFNNTLNKTLHTMAAHLHRYGSELSRLGDIVELINQQHEDLRSYALEHQGDYSLPSTQEATKSALYQIKSHLRDVDTFRQELGNKTQNILALLFNNIQVINDKTLLANGKAMNKMLQASRAEAHMSLRLAEAMKKDSVAMKTIALLTAFFLPGTSFAAILSMPFFAQNAWMTHVNRIWLWVALTIPSTALAFAFYLVWKGRHDDILARSKDQSATELGDILDNDED